MPIEFRCPSCSRGLQTPDQSAGKRAKCPGCGTLVVVPTASSLEPRTLAAEGDEAHSPAEPSVRPPAAADPSPAARTDAPSSAPETPAAAHPVAPPGGAPGSPPAVSFGAAPQVGLPWERERKSVASFWKTAKLIVLKPQHAFQQMRRESLAAPLIFAVCGVLCSALILICLSLLVSSIGFVLGIAGGHAAQLDVGAFLVVLFPAFASYGLMIGGGVIGMLIGTLAAGSLIHFLLLRFRGARYSIVTTLCVVSYVGGVMAFLAAIPCLGLQLAPIVGSVYAIIGLSAAHETTIGKATVAVLLSLAILYFVSCVALLCWFISLPHMAA